MPLITETHGNFPQIKGKALDCLEVIEWRCEPILSGSKKAWRPEPRLELFMFICDLASSSLPDPKGTFAFAESLEVANLIDSGWMREKV